jgi:G3E family GTPase
MVAALRNGSCAAVFAHRFSLEFGLEPNPIVARPESDVKVLLREVFDFGSGCVCCSPTGDLTRVCNEILSEKRPPDYAFLETTGLAEPDAFLELFSSSTHLASAFDLQRVVVVVTARSAYTLCSEMVPTAAERRSPSPRHGGRQTFLRDRATELSRKLETQIRYADTVVVTKVQSESEKMRALSGLDTLWGSTGKSIRAVDLLHSAQAAALAGEILRRVVTQRSLPNATRVRPTAAPQFALVNGLPHDKRFISTCLVEEGAVDWTKTKAWLDSLFQRRTGQAEGQGTILRIKGRLVVRPCNASRSPRSLHHFQTAIIDGSEEGVRVAWNGCSKGSDGDAARGTESPSQVLSRLFVLGQVRWRALLAPSTVPH